MLEPAIVEGPHPADLTVVMLHGYAMGPQDLLPFAHSLGVPARFVVPAGPIELSPGKRSWWHINARRRARSLTQGPRDLTNEYPEGREEARDALEAMLQRLERSRGPLGRLVLLGFSQGGMLACDFMLHAARRVDGLILLSSTRAAFGEWEPLLPRARALPVLLAHGRDDADLAFHAGEALRDCLAHAGASVQWLPFDGGHEIALPVWRQVRKFLRSLVCQQDDKAP